ncbi:hypothetical protein [Saccharolobus sp. E5-1-F]|nr:hypothetical protein [Sulfolobus sp. E5-1-F]
MKFGFYIIISDVRNALTHDKTRTGERIRGDKIHSQEREELS